MAEKEEAGPARVTESAASDPGGEASEPDSGRRAALKVVGTVLASSMAGAFLGPGVLYVIDPLRRRPPGPGSAAVPVARLGEVPELSTAASGEPLRAAVVQRGVRDAWSKLDEATQGSVWLHRRGERVTCFSTVCPHAGCGVDYDPAKRCFVCPCHTSSFDLDGNRLSGPSPRGLDRLEVEVRDGTVYCQYQRFRLASPNKEPV